jgi:hypothetical protein
LPQPRCLVRFGHRCLRTASFDYTISPSAAPANDVDSSGRRGTIGGMARPSTYEYAGGAPAFLALATDFHARCLADPVLEHPFSHMGNPEHVQRLADYWGEVFGGPPIYSRSFGGHSAMLSLHANQGAEAG